MGNRKVKPEKRVDLARKRRFEGGLMLILASSLRMVHQFNKNRGPWHLTGAMDLCFYVSG